MLLRLPQELLAEFLGLLSKDVRTLRAVALTCRRLLPIAREHLLSVIGFQALAQDCIRPYLARVLELRITREDVPDLYAVARGQPSPYYAHPDHLPRLATITVTGVSIGFYDNPLPPWIGTVTLFTTVTELKLSRVNVLNFAHIQTLLSALTSLSSLTFDYVKVRAFDHLPFNAEPVIDGSQYTPPSHLSLLTVRGRRTEASALAKWLSGSTLTLLAIAHDFELPQLVLRHFGPGVRHLSTPLRNLEYGPDERLLDDYTDLRSVTIFLDPYEKSPGPWYLLPPLLERAIPSRVMEKVTLSVQVEHWNDLHAAVDWKAFDRLNDVLDDEKFESLKDLEFFVQLKRAIALDWNPKEELQAIFDRIEERLYNIAGPGKLVTRSERV